MKKTELDDDAGAQDNSATIDQSLKTESQHRRHRDKDKRVCDSLPYDDKTRSVQSTTLGGENAETKDLRKMEFELQMKEDQIAKLMAEL
jgi:hypothetical protein